VLRLKRLDPLDAAPGAADRGTIIHQALDRFLHAFPEALPADALAQLLVMGREAFGAMLERPGVRAFWWPRFERIARWFVGHEAMWRAGTAGVAAERDGRLELAAPAGPFALTARADRIDRLRDGGLGIVDFKTGGLPSHAEIASGYAPQLPLEAAIAEAGGFTGVAAAPVAALTLWQLSGRDPAGTVRLLVKDAAALRRLIDEARAGLGALIARFDDQDTPYRSEPRPDLAPRYSDYRHLARIKEWLTPGDGEVEE
jgi:ATP-dependent helicase/nuclease subunit B